MPSATDERPSDAPEKTKLVLFFDGTGNTFSGSNADTNVVKLLRKLDRDHAHQFHYYQTGIGTYDINEMSVNKTVYGELKSSLSKTWDQGFGSTFDAHDAKIYMFGFSRGAFTAKFLARMINKVGLLCKGNEEMVPFAYRLYQRYLQEEAGDRETAACTSKHDHGEPNGSATTNGNAAANGTSPEHEPLVPKTPQKDNMMSNKVYQRSESTEEALDEIKAFSQTFCRKETNAKSGQVENIKVFFLGIWDCVSSVAVIERKAPIPVAVTGTAKHVRHAVAVDERRVKFKPALLAQDIKNAIHDVHIPTDQEDIKEVWFPGNHGDVGGGWPAADDAAMENKGFWHHIWSSLKTWRAKKASKNLDTDRLQMSDVPLEWMIREVKKCGEIDRDAAVHWSDSLEKFEQNMRDADRRLEIATSAMHDCLAIGRGTSFFKVIMWNLMEWLPFITRWELNDSARDSRLRGWQKKMFPPNRASARDIPRGAVLHQSLLDRLASRDEYRPRNNHGDHSDECLSTRKGVAVYDMDQDRHDFDKKRAAKFRVHEEDVFEDVCENGHFSKRLVERRTVREDDARHQTYDFYTWSES